MRTKKIFLITLLIIILLSSMLIGKNILFNIKNHKQDIETLICEYQLPNGLFFDSVQIEENADVYSTCYMQKIKNLAVEEAIEIDVDELIFTYDNIQEIYYLQDLPVYLSENACKSYQEYIERILQEDGLVSFSENDGEASRMIFTLYVIKFAKQYNLNIESTDSIQSNIQIKLDNVSSDKSIFYVSTLLQLASILDLDYDLNFYKKFYEEKLDYFENLSEIMDSDIMDLYYLSIIRNIIQADRSISANLANSVADAINYSYTNLSLFYDCVYILDTYSVLKNYASIIINNIQLLDDYKVSDKYYSAISVINPSLLATYCGVAILQDMGKMKDELDNIKLYLLNYRELGNLKSMSCEDIYYYYNTLIILDNKILYDKELKQEVLDVLLSNLNSTDVLSIRELYCVQMLNKQILQNDKITKAIKNKLDEALPDIKLDEISTANYCMLLIIIKDFPDEYNEIVSKAEKMDSNLVTIMDAYYYVEYCNVYGITTNESAVKALLKAVENDNGYYIGKYQKENSMFTLFLGYSLENR